MNDAVTVFSPGEVIFFGEHSVVYDRRALAAAISRGITATGRVLDESLIEVRSKFGVIRAVSKGRMGFDQLVPDPSHGYEGVEVVKHLSPLLHEITCLMGLSEKVCALKGISVEIQSDIPEQAGLASSAAVSAALMKLVLTLAGEEVELGRFIKDFVYRGEIIIQRRGSIVGSACTGYGGLVRVVQGKPEKLPFPKQLPALAVIDSRTRCATSVTTQRVARQHGLSPEKIGRRFDEMNDIALRGEDALYKGDWGEMGRLMNENQQHLKDLGVSCNEIDSMINAIKGEVFGAKITGAGGGGCIVCLPKNPNDSRLEGLVRRSGGEYFEVNISSEGTRVVSGEAACKP